MEYGCKEIDLLFLFFFYFSFYDIIVVYGGLYMALTYNFDELNEETQRYLKKVMDIYAAIEGKKLVVNNKELTLIDKKVISLFIAGFLIYIYLKIIVSQYDIKIKDLLDFVQLYEDDIVPFDTYDMLSKRYENYADYYNSVFKINLMDTVSKVLRNMMLTFYLQN